MSEKVKTDRALVEQERLAAAADYLGYGQDTSGWSQLIQGEKYARIKAHVEFLRAFTDESRLEIIIFLMHGRGGQGELPRYSVSEIAARFNLSLSTVSHHLQELKRVGIVKVERCGKERVYQYDLDYVIEQVGRWHERLLAKRSVLRQNQAAGEAGFTSDEDKSGGNEAPGSSEINLTSN